MAARQNCWESLKCGKEKECPAYPNFGKTCFSVKGTLCNGRKQGGYLEKANECRDRCSFYKEMFGGK
ncbi:MAG: hypothetical protein BWK80_07765 [Desulfobacteraceae bacterium IS3]|jgi:hypothetical protein|nr:MAG: hypothetical protein BWK80_07765 [Desulfobacteraceae bacterium IS3]